MAKTAAYPPTGSSEFDRAAHGVNANQVFYWRTLYRKGRVSIGPPTTK
jgi:hypothetical protein